ncbi:MAG: hypothetical protein QOF21_650 [Actinomycetota bacterium]
MAEWDAVAASYEEALEPTTAGFADRYRDVVDGTVADIGAGPGVVSVSLAKAGVEVVATDLSAAMVDQLVARVDRLALAAHVHAFVADAQSLPLADNSVDGAVSNFGIIFCPDVDAALREMVRVARNAVAFTAWTSAANNGWTWLLPDGYEDELGFQLSTRPMFKWTAIDELRDACTRAGWLAVDIELGDAPATTYPSWRDIGDVLERPATKAAIASLTNDQQTRLGAYLEVRAHEAFGDGEVSLPREAWFVRGRSKKSFAGR